MKSEKVIGWLRRNFLVVSTIAAVIIGAVLGSLIRLAQPSSQTIMLLSFPGEILMHMLKVEIYFIICSHMLNYHFQMMIIPLIVSSLISGFLCRSSV